MPIRGNIRAPGLRSFPRQQRGYLVALQNDVRWTCKGWRKSANLRNPYIEKYYTITGRSGQLKSSGRLALATRRSVSRLWRRAHSFWVSRVGLR
jgi:hypothetical protein